MEVKVTLQSWTQWPIGTVYCMWHSNRELGPCPMPQDVDEKDPKVLELFKKVMESDLPVGDGINFVFLLENVSISLREQMVRHRIGMRFGDQIGVDMVPELAQSTWWGQGFRILDMSKFADENRYLTPESVSENTEAQKIYNSSMLDAQQDYKNLLELGVPMEDARNVLPLGATHSINWVINLTALKHVLKKRSCWILQLGLWEPVIRGMIEELEKKVHPWFRQLVNPPCIKDGKFDECKFKLDNERRISGEDQTVPCSLYLHNEIVPVNFAPATMEPARYKQYVKLKQQYQRLWGRDANTGKLIDEMTEEELDGNTGRKGWDA